MSYQVRCKKDCMSKGLFTLDREYVKFTNRQTYNCEELKDNDTNIEYYYIYNEDKSIWSTFSLEEFELFFEKI